MDGSMDRRRGWKAGWQAGVQARKQAERQAGGRIKKTVANGASVRQHEGWVYCLSHTLNPLMGTFFGGRMVTDVVLHEVGDTAAIFKHAKACDVPFT